jgi:hypothetical protein
MNIQSPGERFVLTTNERELFSARVLWISGQGGEVGDLKIQILHFKSANRGIRIAPKTLAHTTGRLWIGTFLAALGNAPKEFRRNINAVNAIRCLVLT